MRTLVACLALTTLGGCGTLGYPATVTPVQNFELPRYLGTWYEIARLDHSFERGLDQVTAEYTMRDDGGVRVTNRGYSSSKNAWKESVGRAYFVRGPEEGYLKVSFFGPFYGSYVVYELDEQDYQHAFVSGPDEDYLWLLSRTPTVSDELLDHFKEQAETKGFDTDSLIYVDHE